MRVLMTDCMLTGGSGLKATYVSFCMSVHVCLLLLLWPFAPESYSIHNIIPVVQHQSADCETHLTTPHTQTLTNTHTHTHTAAQPGIARSHTLLPTTASLIHLSLAGLTQEKQPPPTPPPVSPSLPSLSI